MVNYIIKTLAKIAIFFVCFISANISLFYLFVSCFVETPRYWRVAIGFDQTGNAVLGGNPDETLSSRAARAMNRGERWGCILCKLLDHVQKDHCQKSLGV